MPQARIQVYPRTWMIYKVSEETNQVNLGICAQGNVYLCFILEIATTSDPW
jgi:hypothetical protein